MMASTSVLLLQLLLVSLVSGSHYFGGLSIYRGGINSDGTFTVNFSLKGTFDGCYHSLSMHCYSNNCGYEVSRHRVVLDNSTNSPQHNRQWCETETLITRRVPSNKPFSMRSASCCWIPSRNHINNWRLLTTVDLGTRGDTGKPNNSPVTGMLPFVRVPQNCPRAYKLMAFDADGDRVRCRYGKVANVECGSCSQPVGFSLDQDSCTLYYKSALNDSRVNGFELVVEDFPRLPITLSYSDGSHSSRSPLMARKKRQVNPYVGNWQTWSSPTAYPWSSWPTITPAPGWQSQTTTTSTPTSAPSTMFLVTPAPPTWSGWKPTTRHPSWRHQTGPGQPHTVAVAIPWVWYNSTQNFGATTRQPVTQTPSLSKLPFQFSLLVDPSIPSCQEGHYIPKLVYPTPQNGQRIYAEVNKEVEIRVKAQARYAQIHDIIMSGPMNSNKHRTTRGEFVIRWTPKPGDEGGHYPLCFAVESVQSRSSLAVYQSEMTCVLLDVQKETVKAKVTCAESSMTVAVEKSSLHGIHLAHLRLNDPSNIECSLQRHSNSTHVVAVIPLNSCGTQLEEDDEDLIFKNEITTVDNPQNVITRKHRLEVDFHCQYRKRGNVTLSFNAHRKTITVWEKGFGMFTYQFEFYPNDTFQTMISPTSYPLEYQLGSRIYMKIEASSSLNNTELFVESCRAAPYDNPNFQPTYSIIENGCTMDQTVQIYAPAHAHEFRFSMEAFQFIGLHDRVYISCSVLMCEAGNPNTRCSHGCINTKRTNGNQHHVKREAVIQSANHFVSQGPLRLKRSPESNESTAMNLNMNLVFIVGCLLAVVGMISAVAMYKAKMSKARYERLPTNES
ncbi:uncharacterized protein LOC133153218 [Syngnathus typhle]|uniref:uncharacterized protein LOC133153218 n=1 Tax=Syngnathus typhle TaxID=161592 RepID=UPI002A6A86F7|nr:uncharacterized protein LOC133153218 [Syngnathus typhle]